MATLYGTQMTAMRAVPQQKLRPDEWGGEVRVAYFDWTADAAQNDFVELTKLPLGSRILGGRLDFTAFGASVTLDIGDETTENLFLSAKDVSAAGQSDFANTVALGLDSVVVAATTPKYAGFVTIQAKFEAANPASGTLKGHVLYAVT